MLELGLGLGLECIQYIKLLIQYIKLLIQYTMNWAANHVYMMHLVSELTNPITVGCRRDLNNSSLRLECVVEPYPYLIPKGISVPTISDS